MKLEDQVVSFKLSKKLKSLDVKQDSLFYWHNIDTIPSIIYKEHLSERSGDFLISAFSVAELSKMIPPIIYVNLENDKNLANAMAKILIDLIESQLIELPESQE